MPEQQNAKRTMLWSKIDIGQKSAFFDCLCCSLERICCELRFSILFYYGRAKYSRFCVRRRYESVHIKDKLIFTGKALGSFRGYGALLSFSERLASEKQVGTRTIHTARAHGPS